MKYILLLTAVFCFATSCRKCTLPKDLPECVRAEIDAHQNNSEWEIGAVKEYQFQGTIVYAFEPDNRIIADASTIIKTSNCSELCQVGGFGGPAIQMCNGDRFFDKAILVRVIWEK